MFKNLSEYTKETLRIIVPIVFVLAWVAAISISAKKVFQLFGCRGAEYVSITLLFLLCLFVHSIIRNNPTFQNAGKTSEEEKPISSKHEGYWFFFLSYLIFILWMLILNWFYHR